MPSSLYTLIDGLRLVILREQFLDAIDGMCRDSAQYIREPFEWVDAMRFARTQQTINHGGSLRRFIVVIVIRDPLKLFLPSLNSVVIRFCWI